MNNLLKIGESTVFPWKWRYTVTEYKITLPRKVLKKVKGTALLINKDQTVTVLEDVEHEVYETIVSQEDCEDVTCTINKKTIHFDPISKAVWLDDTIDWSYGY